MDALGNVTTFTYDGNGNLVSKTDPDGYTTEYTYNALDLVTSINYNNAKEVSYRYNATGDLVSMTDWLGTTTFELDLLHQITAATDHKGNRVEYTYDGVGNQTSIAYPDGTTATYDYDLVQNQTKVTETDGSETAYVYDGMGRVTEMYYPNGWVEYYTYDSMGRLLAVNDTHPSEKPAKTQKHTYEYDANGNIVYEYMRGNGTGQAKNETLYTYDALNRLITAHDNYGNSTRTYTYDSLGNLTYETGDGSHNMDYRYNNLNQLVEQSDDGWKTYTASSYDARGNLVLEEYHKNKKTINTIGQYFFDETNKMVRGINAAGEESIYTYNGLGALMENTWIIAQNAYGYHGVNADTSANESVNGQGNGNSSGNTAGNNGNGNGNVKKTSTVIKQFVVDFTSETFDPLMEHEVNGLDYRYVYSDKARLSVVVQGIENGSASLLDEAGELHAYYHTDYLGTTDYLTSAVNSKVISWTYYNEWGEITHNAVLNCGARELDLVKLYATHDFDAVLTQYYAKARFYDVDNRRFTAVDPILDPSQYDLQAYVTDPMQLVQYLYVKDNAVNWIDPDGELAFLAATAIAGAVVGGLVSGVVSGYRAYTAAKEQGVSGTELAKTVAKSAVSSAAKGALVGGAVGLGVGTVAAVATAGITGSVAATTAAVTGTSAGKAVATVAIAATASTSVQQADKIAKNEKITVSSVLSDAATNTATSAAYVMPVTRIAIGTVKGAEDLNEAVEATKSGDIKTAVVEYASAGLNALAAASGVAETLPAVTNYMNKLFCTNGGTPQASLTGVGNAVKVEGRGSTGRTLPSDLQEQMAMHQVQSAPLDGARKLAFEMGDPRWPAAEKWVKMENVVRLPDRNITIHFVYNEVTGAFDDFKFKN